MTKVDCGYCPNCTTKARWDETYNRFLKDHPSKENREFVRRMKKTDKTLKCLHPVSPEEKMDMEAKAAIGYGYAN